MDPCKALDHPNNFRSVSFPTVAINYSSPALSNPTYGSMQGSGPPEELRSVSFPTVAINYSSPALWILVMDPCKALDHPKNFDRLAFRL